VLLVDDDALVCQGLELMLSTADDLEVVGAVHDGDGVVEAVHRHAPDVVLLDVRMGRQDGITATRSLRRLADPPKIIVLTTFDHDEVMLRAVEAGADGFLLKTASPAEILAAVRNVAAGGGAVSPGSARQLFHHVRHDPSALARRSAQAAMVTLTAREREVVRAVARGLSNAQIAAELFASEATVKTHLAHAQAKLGCSGRVEVAVLVERSGLLAGVGS
jgi:DNA-binding NarL/FixJ family response regulator